MHFNGLTHQAFDLVRLSCLAADGTDKATRVTKNADFDQYAATYEYGEIELGDGESCLLDVRWEREGNYTEFTGGTLSRTGLAYSIDGNATLDVQGIRVQSADIIYPPTRALYRYTDREVIDQPARTIGTSVTLNFEVRQQGPNFLVVDRVAIENANNVTIKSHPDPPTELPNDGTYIEYRYEVSVTFEPTHETDYGFDIVFYNNRDPVDGEFRLTFGQPATSDTGDDDDDNEITNRTKRIISNFMARRAAQIVGKEPDLTKRLADGGMSSRSGPVSGPVNVSGSGTTNNYNLAFATSLRQVVGSSGPAKRKRIMDSGSRMALGAGDTSGRKGSQKAGVSSSL
ncbi:MAG: hypothetical protein AAF709_14265, partial [Pseudomonadota bacterium]